MSGGIRSLAVGACAALMTLTAVPPSGAVAGRPAAATPAPQVEPLPEGWVDLRDPRPDLESLIETAGRRIGSARFWVGYTFDLGPEAHVGCDLSGSYSGIHFADGDTVVIRHDDETWIVDEDCTGSFGLFLRIERSSRGLEVRGVRLAGFRRAGRLEGPVAWAGAYDGARSVDFIAGGVASELGSSSLTARTRRLDGKHRERLLLAAAVHEDPAGLALARRALTDAADPELREQAVMLTATFGGDEEIDLLLDVARSDRSRGVRKSAIFWLGQEAGEVATESLVGIAEDDPDTEIRKSAVFALSQSDDPGALDGLVRIVRENRNPGVVKAALFWLGQSGDPKALALFEEILIGGRR